MFHLGRTVDYGTRQTPRAEADFSMRHVYFNSSRCNSSIILLNQKYRMSTMFFFPGLFEHLSKQIITNGYKNI